MYHIPEELLDHDQNHCNLQPSHLGVRTLMFHFIHQAENYDNI